MMKEVKLNVAIQFLLVAAFGLTSTAPITAKSPARQIAQSSSDSDSSSEQSTGSKGSGHVLYGRIEDYKSPAGPSFPTLKGSTASQGLEGKASSDALEGKASSQVLKGNASDSEFPADIRGTWHGELSVTACKATDAGVDWDASFVHTWLLQKERKGPGLFTFTRKGGGTKLSSAQCIFNIPMRQMEVTYNKVINAFLDPTNDEINAINMIIKPLSSAIVVYLAEKKGQEVLESGVPNQLNSEYRTTKRLSENVWQNDAISKRTFFFDPPKGKQVIYTESVATVTRKSDDKLYFESAEARFNGSKEPLCYLILEGELTKGAIQLPDHSDVSLDLQPVQGGVSIKGTGAFGTKCAGEIEGAKLRPNNFEFGF